MIFNYCIFFKLGEKNPDSLAPLLVNLAQLRGSQNFSHEAELDLVIGLYLYLCASRS